MNTEVKNYVESTIEEKYQNGDLGFLVLNTFEQAPGKWQYLGCEVEVVEFNREHTFIKAINGKHIAGETNPEILSRYKETKEQPGKHISARLFWHTYSLKETLQNYAESNKTNKTVPNLDKQSFSKKELDAICEEAKKLTYEDWKEANNRATNYARKM